MRDEARALARHVDRAIQRRKLKAVKSARGLYRIAKGFITNDAGDAVRPHVAEMKRALGGRRRERGFSWSLLRLRLAAARRRAGELPGLKGRASRDIIRRGRGLVL